MKKDPYLEELDSSLEGLPEDEMPEGESTEAVPPPRPPPKKAEKAKPPPAPPPPPRSGRARSDVAGDVPLKLVAVIGRKDVMVKDVMKLKVGQVLELDRTPEDAVEIFAGGKLVAKGELVDVEGQLGVRIIKMVG